MELNDEQFWRALRQALELAEADEAKEMAAAERLLADTSVDAGAQLSEERIAEVVRFATAPSAAELEAAAYDEARDEPRAEPHDAERRAAPIALAPVPAPRPSWRRRLIAALPRPLAAAAALLLAPTFLAAATVVTVVVVTTVMLRHTTHTLPYQDAVAILVNEEQTELSRRSAQTKVTSTILVSIGVLDAVVAENSEVSDPAAAVLTRLRGLLVSGGPFQLMVHPDPHLELGDRVADKSLAIDQRKESLAILADQMAYGVLALKVIEQASGPAVLKSSNAVCLSHLANALR